MVRPLGRPRRTIVDLSTHVRSTLCKGPPHYSTDYSTLGFLASTLFLSPFPYHASIDIRASHRIPWARKPVWHASSPLASEKMYHSLEFFIIAVWFVPETRTLGKRRFRQDPARRLIFPLIAHILYYTITSSTSTYHLTREILVRLNLLLWWCR
jgi:hypothetical protein